MLSLFVSYLRHIWKRNNFCCPKIQLSKIVVFSRMFKHTSSLGHKPVIFSWRLDLNRLSFDCIKFYFYSENIIRFYHFAINVVGELHFECVALLTVYRNFTNFGKELSDQKFIDKKMTTKILGTLRSVQANSNLCANILLYTYNELCIC